jgi:hypothetical protein
LHAGKIPRLTMEERALLAQAAGAAGR